MAAGLGFKTFQTGEVLTASDVNGYLMQGVLVFATEAARNSAITSPQEGQFAFTKDNNSLWYYTGSAWAASGATGDIEGVTAGTGISGGGTSGTVTITNSMATAIDAKGDLIVGTGADTFARLAVGTNGHTLVADSSTATGLAYAAPASASFVGCNIYLSSNQSIATATATAIQFNAETFDTDNFHDNSTNNTRVTIPSGKGGKYLFTAWANLETNATGYRNLELLKNGSSLTGSWSIGFTPNATGYAGFCGAVVINLSAGDYMEVLYTQTSGSNKNIIGSIYGATGLSCAYLGA